MNRARQMKDVQKDKFRWIGTLLVHGRQIVRCPTGIGRIGERVRLIGDDLGDEGKHIVPLQSNIGIHVLQGVEIGRQIVIDVVGHPHVQRGRIHLTDVWKHIGWHLVEDEQVSCAESDQSANGVQNAIHIPCRSSTRAEDKIIPANPDDVDCSIEVRFIGRDVLHVTVYLLSNTRHLNGIGFGVAFDVVGIRRRASIGVTTLVVDGQEIDPVAIVREASFVVRRNDRPGLVGQSVDIAVVGVRIAEDDRSIEAADASGLHRAERTVDDKYEHDDESHVD